MKINASEIKDILKEKIKDFNAEFKMIEVGHVLSVGDGIAHVYGLDNVIRVRTGDEGIDAL